MMPCNVVRDFVSVVKISEFSFEFWRWVPGQQLPGKLIAIDAETEKLCDREIPRLALVVASGDRQNVLIHPDDLGKFLTQHRGKEVVCHNAAFDFWVIEQHLRSTGETEASIVWSQFVTDRRLHDTMLLDILLRISRGGTPASSGSDDGIAPRNLADVCLEYTGMDMSKDDPYRTRFGELIDCQWENIDSGFFEYAIKDSICTLLTYREMRQIAIEIMQDAGYTTTEKPHYDIYHDAPARFGLLSEAIQVEGAIALAAISRNGLHTNQERLETAENAFRQRFDQVVQEIRSEYPGIFAVDRSGTPAVTATGLPKVSNLKLDEYLTAAIEQLRQETREDVVLPRTANGKVSHASGQWNRLTNRHPFLRLWASFQKMAKDRQFYESLRKPVIHPRYTVMVRTGRTSCSSPNMQQVPRDDLFRNVIVPSPGHLLLTVDYSFVELVTLAAVCQARFGSSVLGDIIRNGIDPHCYTAAMFEQMSLHDLMALKQSAPERFKLARQQAKPVNFGVPGGLGIEALVSYARSTYGVDMSNQQAEEFRRRLTTDVYPEIGKYLEGNDLAHLARQIACPVPNCISAFCFGDMSAGAAAAIVRKIVSGNPVKKNGQPYNSTFVANTWGKLLWLNRNPAFTEELIQKIGSPDLSHRLFPDMAVTLTGRVRGNVTYTQQRNTPFQSLASDGAKRALGRLVLQGFRVVGFVHDEILIELPDQGDYVDRSIVEKVLCIMRESMQEMTAGVPVSCEYTLSDRWSKNAELIIDDDKVRAWRPDRV